MNHDYAHCLDCDSDCPYDCFRAQLVADLKCNNIQPFANFVSWMHIKGTDECKRGDKDADPED